MKKNLLLIAIAGLWCMAGFARIPLDSFVVLGKDLLSKTIVAWSRDDGRLVRFTADATDITNIKRGDVIDINLQSKQMTFKEGVRNYNIMQPDRAEPVGIITILQVDKAGPVNGIIRPAMNKPGTTNRPRLNAAGPINSIVNIQQDGYASIVKAQGTTGPAFQFRVPSFVGRNLKVGGPVYSDSLSGFVIVQVDVADQMTSYGYPIESVENSVSGTSENTEKWEIVPVAGLRGVAGRLLTEFPKGVTGRYEIYDANGKYITSIAEIAKQKFHTIAPGHYRITLSSIPLENVPIQSGKSTRIKYGFLNIITEGTWQLFDSAKDKYFTSDNKPMKLALPVGTYEVKLGSAFYHSPIVIKDGETVTF